MLRVVVVVVTTLVIAAEIVGNNWSAGPPWCQEDFSSNKTWFDPFPIGLFNVMVPEARIFGHSGRNGCDLLQFSCVIVPSLICLDMRAMNDHVIFKSCLLYTSPSPRD